MVIGGGGATGSTGPCRGGRRRQRFGRGRSRREGSRRRGDPGLQRVVGVAQIVRIARRGNQRGAFSSPTECRASASASTSGS